MATKTKQQDTWRVDWETWKTLEVAATPELIALAKKLSARLHRSTGHKEAHLYQTWAHKHGRPYVEKWWAKQA